jgi:hypothetical protein
MRRVQRRELIPRQWKQLERAVNPAFRQSILAMGLIKVCRHDAKRLTDDPEPSPAGSLRAGLWAGPAPDENLDVRAGPRRAGLAWARRLTGAAGPLGTLRCCNQPFPNCLLAGCLAGPAHGFRMLAGFALRGFLVSLALFHLAKHAFPLHLLLEHS